MTKEIALAYLSDAVVNIRHIDRLGNRDGIKFESYTSGCVIHKGFDMIAHAIGATIHYKYTGHVFNEGIAWFEYGGVKFIGVWN